MRETSFINGRKPGCQVRSGNIHGMTGQDKTLFNVHIQSKNIKHKSIQDRTPWRKLKQDWYVGITEISGAMSQIGMWV